jgi:surface protein
LSEEEKAFALVRTGKLQEWKVKHKISPKCQFDAILCHRYGIPVELRVIIHSYLSLVFDNMALKDALHFWTYGSGSKIPRDLIPLIPRCRPFDIDDIIAQCGHPSDWNTSKVTSMSRLFANWSTFNEDINGWDVSHVTSMFGMFADATEFNQPLDSWDVSHVQDMTRMFHNAYAFNQPLDSWNVRQVRTMTSMFENAGEFNQSLNLWQVRSVKDMSRMFYGAKRFNQPLNRWDMRTVLKMDAMFDDKFVFEGHLKAWKIK